MSHPKKPSTEIIVAIIGATALILAAIISGLFLLASKTTTQSSSSSTASPHITPILSGFPQSTASPTSVPTPVQTPNPYPPYRGTLLYDPLSDTSNSAFGWENRTKTQFGSCNFTQDGYYVASYPKVYHRCVALNTNFRNFAFEVEMSIKVGDCGGMIFRADALHTNYYYFTICQSNLYNFYVYEGGSIVKIQDSIFNPNIPSNLNQFNRIAVVANNASITLYVNTISVYNLADSTYSQGQIGLIAESDTNNSSANVTFSNAKVWIL